MNDLAKCVAHLTIAARAGLTPAECLERDLQQQAYFEAWRREVDAVGESAGMGGWARDTHPGVGPISPEACKQATDHPSLPSDDAFTFAPECRELAAHFMPGADAIGIDYLAQALMDCVTEYLAIKEEFRK